MDEKFIQQENKFMSDLYQKNAQILELLTRVGNLEAQLQDTLSKYEESLTLREEAIKTITELEERVALLTIPISLDEAIANQYDKKDDDNDLF